MSRIASVNCGSIWEQTFGYDAFGNLTKSGSISWMPGYNSSTNHYTLGGSGYDANGNLLNDTFNTYTWDAEGKPLSTTYSSGETYTFVYDAFGHEVEWSVNGTYENSVVNIGKFRLSAIGQTAYYSETPFPGGSVASQNGGDTVVQLGDWLGTIRATFAYTGGAEAWSDNHAPFGESYPATGYPGSFTGQLNDADEMNTTYYFPERQYRSNQGRWLSPDPAGINAVDFTNPQSWNRYAYVSNTPLNTVDLSGLGTIDVGLMARYWSHHQTWNAPGCNQTFINPGFGSNCTWVDPFDTQSVPLVYPSYEGTCYNCFIVGPLVSAAASTAQSRVGQITNHLQQCGGVYPLVAAAAGNFNIGTVAPNNPGQLPYAATSPTDVSLGMFNGGNSTTTIDAVNFTNADPVTQTGVVVHEWFTPCK